jgi:kynurenine 3-monooxygenase
MQKNINIIGAGLTGSLLAIFLAKRGHTVHVYEKRADMRKTTVEAGRSINLALSSRGIRALEQAGIAQEVLQHAIQMSGRMLHATNGSLTYVPYGKNQTEHINSISRGGLNMALLDLAETFPNIHLHFSHALKHVDLEKGISYLKLLGANNIEQGEIIESRAEHTFGTDGAGSIIRQAMEKAEKFTHSTDFLEHGYKELTIPPTAEGGFRMERNALHIWPRGTYMLIALPNLDGSFTCTLFFPNHGENSFDTLKTPEQIQQFFQNTFPDTIALIPNLIYEFQHNPVGLLGTVRCYPWHYKDTFLLLGDAAHAVVPFYGQGMNASFEDCLELMPLLEGQEKWNEAFELFSKTRKPNADAIADLAIENFYEMRDGTAKPAFLRMRQLESLLEAQYPDYLSKYAMVTFHPEVPYSVAKKRGNIQNDYLLALCEEHEDVLSINVAEVYKILQEKIRTV